MDALDKQISRLHPHVQKGMPHEQLRSTMQVLNAMRSAAQSAGSDEAVKRWARKNMTAIDRANLVKLAEIVDQHDAAVPQMDGLIKFMLTLL